jgi:hypothetical protein
MTPLRHLLTPFLTRPRLEILPHAPAQSMGGRSWAWRGPTGSPPGRNRATNIKRGAIQFPAILIAAIYLCYLPVYFASRK